MKKVSLFVVLAVALLVSGVAFAELVEGTVAAIDLTGNTIKVTTTDAATGTAQELTISVSDTTAYSGEVTALDELVEGDEAKIEAEKDAVTGSWVAKSVEIPTIELGAEEEAAPAVVPAAEPVAAPAAQ